MRTAIALTIVGLLVATPAAAQIQFPSSWAGVWDITTTERNCGSSTVTDMYTDTDTICAGEVFSAGDEAEFECTGSVGDTSIDVTCSSTFGAFPGCDVTFAYTVNGTRNGNNLSGTETFSITYVGTCPLPNECTEGDLVGVRTGSEPPGCTTTAVAPVSWARAKKLYR